MLVPTVHAGGWSTLDGPAHTQGWPRSPRGYQFNKCFIKPLLEEQPLFPALET